MKKLVKVFAVLLVFLCVFGVLSACTPQPVGEKGEVYFCVLVDGVSVTFETTFDTSNTDMVTLSDLMEYLQENNGNFTYTESGGMVVSILGITADSLLREFWAIYTDCEVGGIPYFDNSWGTVTVNNKTLGSASKGIKELPLQKGATYVFEKSNW